jgi:hypothetical protein
MKTFHELAATWGLRYFSAAELLTKGGSHSAANPNGEPARVLWGNIREAALAADEARHRLGSPILIASGYRSLAYNRAIGGAKGSYHLQFRALDLRPTRAAPEALHAILLQLRKEGFPGAKGIGKYPTFCHTDNGPVRDF